MNQNRTVEKKDRKKYWEKKNHKKTRLVKNGIGGK
jgi:hypothetical protein